jgi:basic membrane lipoprotein Med (substrate-binding protein (PBP1-ABC) superfamily)
MCIASGGRSRKMALLIVGILLGGMTVAQQSNLVIGMLLPGPKNDAGYNQSFYDAAMETQRNVPGVRVIVAEYVTDGEAESTMETMIRQGAKLILPCGFSLQYPAIAVAAKNPISATSSRRPSSTSTSWASRQD